MPSLAADTSMMVRDRERLGLRECRAAWLLGLTVREYRALEAGELTPNYDMWDRLSTFYGWPRSYWPPQGKDDPSQRPMSL